MLMRHRAPLLLAGSLLALGSCSEELAAQLGDGDAAVGPSEGMGVKTEQNPDGTYTTTVWATAEESWIYFSFASGKAANPNLDWDLAFQRFKVRLNGGAGGAGFAMAARVEGLALSAAAQAPDEGWLSDRPDCEGSSDPACERPDIEACEASAGCEWSPGGCRSVGETCGDGAPERAFDEWYGYDPAEHLLSGVPDRIFFVRSGDGERYYRLRFDAYYDEHGTPAVVRFTWGGAEAPDNPPPLGDAGTAPPTPDAGTEPPPPPDALDIDATDSARSVYLQIATRSWLAIDDPAASTAWDLAFSRYEVQSNSGTSGPGLAGARLATPGVVYDELMSAPTVAYVADEMVEVPGPHGNPIVSASPVLNQWYDYNEATHAVTPKDIPFLIRTAGGGYAKLLILRYAGGFYRARLATLERDLRPIALEVDASDASAWVYVSLRQAALTQPDDPASDLGWDLAFSGPRVKTNGGSSGAGQGGAYEVMSAEVGAVQLEAVQEVESAAAIPDEDLDDAGGSYSGSGALATWQAGDEPPTPRDAVFVVRTAEGGWARLQIDAYEGGRYSLRYTYAGAGRSDFVRRQAEP